MLHTETNLTSAPASKPIPTWALVVGAFVILFIRPYPTTHEIDRVILALFTTPVYALVLGAVFYVIERAGGNKKARFMRAYVTALALLAGVQCLGAWLF